MRLTAFVRDNLRWLAAGIAISLASSFGQTFFISLFSGDIRTTFGLTDGEWGGLYTIATLISAACLIQAGRLADDFTTRAMAACVVLLYAAVALAMAGNGAAWMLVPIVAGLRFCGQGMMSHLCMTAIARWFRARRGIAVAVAGLGFSLGEAVLPLIVEAVKPHLGWRGTWVAVSALLLAGFLPAFLWLMARERRPAGTAEAHETSPGLGARHWTRRDVLGHWLFWAILPGVLAPSFIGTSVFFHAVHLSEVKGWDFAVIARAYPAYAVCSVTLAFASGAAIDRWNAPALLPFFLLPMVVASAMVGLAGDETGLFVAFALLGVSQGVVSAFFGTLWPELYGTRHLGAVRAVAISAMVVSSAIGPGLTGALIDAGVAFTDQALFMSGFCLACSAAFVAVTRRIASERALGRG